jgi:hypothetical protein
MWDYPGYLDKLLIEVHQSDEPYVVPANIENGPRVVIIHAVEGALHIFGVFPRGRPNYLLPDR